MATLFKAREIWNRRTNIPDANRSFGNSKNPRQSKAVFPIATLFRFFALLTLFLSLFLPLQKSPLFAVGVDSSMASGSAVYAESALRASKNALYFLDSTISNLALEKQKEQYRKAVIEDFKAQIYLQRFQYAKSYHSSRIVHKILYDLTNELCQDYIKESEKLFNKLAFEIIPGPKDKQQQTRHYLRLAYRDLALTREIYKKSYHLVPYSQHSKKVFEFNKAIKRIKRGRRFAFLAMIYIRTPKDKWLEIERLSFEELGSRIWRLTKEKPDKLRYAAMHFDNHGRLMRKSYRREIINSADLQKELVEDTVLSTPTAR